MLFLKNVDPLAITSTSKIQKYGRSEYPYLLRYLTYVIILHTKKACN